jgi:hypothetical protein
MKSRSTCGFIKQTPQGIVVTSARHCGRGQVNDADQITQMHPYPKQNDPFTHPLFTLQSLEDSLRIGFVG